MEQRESFQPVVKEEVYGLIVETEDQSFEEIDEVVGELVILGELELKRNQLRQEWVTQHVEQVCLVFNVLDEDRDRLDYLDVNQTVLEGHESRQVTLKHVFFNKLLEVDLQVKFLTVYKELGEVPHFFYQESGGVRRQHLDVSEVVKQVSVPLDGVLSVNDSALLSVFLDCLGFLDSSCDCLGTDYRVLIIFMVIVNMQRN